jgi:adenine phosphoribosyltransferase
VSAPIDALLDVLIRDIPDYPNPGVVFKDITPLLGDRTAFAASVEALAAAGREIVDGPIDKVVGIEARGFILAAPVALALGAGFVPVRKAGKLPHETYAVSYALEYGEATLEVHRDAFRSGDRVLIVDDVLATGGTVVATEELVRRCGGEIAGVAVLLALSFLPGLDRLSDGPLAVVRTL